MNTETIWMITIFIWLLLGIAGIALASKKNRNKVVWFIICLLSGVFGLLILACAKALPYNEELEYIEESDELGFWLLIVCIIAQIFSLHYVYHLF